MLLSKQFKRFIQQIKSAKLSHTTMSNTQFSLEKNLSSTVAKNETQMSYNDVYQRAYEAFMDENYDESAKVFRQLKKLDPKNVHNHVNYCISLSKSNKHYDGLKEVKQVLLKMEGNSTAPQNQSNQVQTEQKPAVNPFLKASALVVKAECLDALNQADEAIKCYEEAATMNNQYYLGCSNMCFENKMYTKALSHLISAATIANLSLNEVMLNTMRTLYELRQFKACFELSECYSFLFYTQYEGMYFAGKCSYMLDNPEKARQYLEMSVNVVPNQFESVYALCKLLREQGLHEDALDRLQNFIKYDHSQNQIYLEAAENLLQMKNINYDLAKEYLEQSLILNDNCLRSSILLAEMTTKVEEKAKIIEQAIQKHPDSYELYYLKSQTLSDVSEQVNTLEKCVYLMEQSLTSSDISDRRKYQEIQFQNCQLKYYQELVELYKQRQIQDKLNQVDFAQLNQKIQLTKGKSEKIFSEIFKENMTLSVLQENSKINYSYVSRLSKVFSQNDSKIVKQLISDNEFGSVHFQLGLEYLKRDQFELAQQSFDQIRTKNINHESEFVLNFLKFQTNLELYEYEKSFENVEQLIQVLETKKFSLNIVSKLKKLSDDTQLTTIMSKVQNLNDLKSLCKEQRDMIINIKSLKNIFPQF